MEIKRLQVCCIDDGGQHFNRHRSLGENVGKFLVEPVQLFLGNILTRFKLFESHVRKTYLGFTDYGRVVVFILVNNVIISLFGYFEIVIQKTSVGKFEHILTTALFESVECLDLTESEFKILHLNRIPKHHFAVQSNVRMLLSTCKQF